MGIGMINIVTLFIFLLMLEVVLKFEDIVISLHISKMCNDEV